MGLAELRKSKNLTQQQLADLSGVPRTRINALERGTDGKTVRRLQLDTAIRLADALKVRDLRKLLDD